MINWNPKHKRFVYFHFTTVDGRNEYLKVDTIEYKVYKVTLCSGSKAGRPYMRGFYQLQWSSFLGNYLHALVGKGPYRFLKFTTENQYTEAVRQIIIDFTKT